MGNAVLNWKATLLWRKALRALRLAGHGLTVDIPLGRPGGGEAWHVHIQGWPETETVPNGAGPLDLALRWVTVAYAGAKRHGHTAEGLLRGCRGQLAIPCFRTQSQHTQAGAWTFRASSRYGPREGPFTRAFTKMHFATLKRKTLEYISLLLSEMHSRSSETVSVKQADPGSLGFPFLLSSLLKRTLGVSGGRPACTSCSDG